MTPCEFERAAPRRDPVILERPVTVLAVHEIAGDWVVMAWEPDGTRHLGATVTDAAPAWTGEGDDEA